MNKYFFTSIFIILISISISISLVAEEWLEQKSFTTNRLQRYFKFNSNNEIIVDYFATVYQSTDQGVTWNRKNDGLPSDSPMFDAYFINADTGWVSGCLGMVKKTTNGGKDWINQNSHSHNSIESITFYNKDIGWFTQGLGYYMCRTTDGGDNWLGRKMPVSWPIKALCFVDSLNLWMAGAAGTILKSTNGGDTWLILESGEQSIWFEDIFFINKNIGWVVGQNLIKKTTDGGDTWFIPDTSMKNMYIALYKIFFTDSLHGWTSGSPSDLYFTSDGGERWVIQRKDMTFKQLSDIFVSKDYYGIAVGDSGLILKYTGKINDFVTSEDIISSSSIYPIPASDYISISGFDEYPSNLIIQIYSIEGMKLIESEYKERIDVRRLAPGLYILKFGDKVYKFVKI